MYVYIYIYIGGRYQLWHVGTIMYEERFVEHRSKSSEE